MSPKVMKPVIKQNMKKKPSSTSKKPACKKPSNWSPKATWSPKKGMARMIRRPYSLALKRPAGVV
eukprot:2315695-Amphidinium_carterae.1